MKATVSLIALAAACLTAACTTTATTNSTADSGGGTTIATTDGFAGESQSRQPTAAEADTFVARAERELGELSVIGSRAQWVNATYVTEDTDALAAYFG
ncbi:MAG TPA: hypothetical protein VF689_12400, partial [Allosphingosinicella sp.]